MRTRNYYKINKKDFCDVPMEIHTGTYVSCRKFNIFLTDQNLKLHLGPHHPQQDLRFNTEVGEKHYEAVSLLLLLQEFLAIRRPR